MFERYRDIQQRRENGELSESGFTLIELLIVIIVLGILAAIVIFSLTGVTGQSQAAACASDAKTVETAVSAYMAENNTPPGSLTALTVTDASGHGPYLRAVPTASVASNGYSIGLTTTATNATVTITTKSYTGVSFDTTTGQTACSSL